MMQTPLSGMQTVPLVTLNNGVTMPQFGLGVWQAQDGAEVERAVSVALECGYRMIDTAAIYHNERGVGTAIAASGIPRKELFITTKLWNTDQGYDTTLKAYNTSLDKLQLDYVDLYLIHWPQPRDGKFVETWRAFEKLYEDKRIRAIGVSNFKPAHLEELLKKAKVVPMINQVELHPKLQQHETRDFCVQHDIKVESYSPIMRGSELLNDSVLTKLSEKYNKTPAQVVLRWHIQSGLIVIPKSVTPSRIKENIDIFDFKLSDDDMRAIADMNADQRIGIDPDKF